MDTNGRTGGDTTGRTSRTGRTSVDTNGRTGGDKTGRTGRTGRTGGDTNGRTGVDTSLLSTYQRYCCTPSFLLFFFFDVDNKSGRYLAAC